MVLRAIATVLLLALLPWRAPALAQPQVPYEVSITGISDAALLKHLQSVSQLIARRDRPPPSMSALRRRLAEDLELFKAALESWGHFSGSVRPRLQEGGSPVSIAIAVEPGPAYRLSVVRLEPQEGEPALPHDKAELGDLGLETGAPFRAEAVLQAERRIVERLGWQGYPFARVPDRRLIADHSTQTVEATFYVSPGPLARFGEAEISGLTGISAELVRNRFAWRPGELWDTRKVVTTRNALVATGLFESVRLDPVQPAGENGRLPIAVALAEAEHRSIGAGLSFSTSEGPGAKAFWEHRNLLNHGERLRVSAEASGVFYGVRGDLRRPDFLRPDQALLLSLDIGREDTEAYVSRRAAASGAVERRFSEILTGSAGVLVERSYAEENGRDLNTTLVGLPLTLTLDTSDSLLDPTRGLRLGLGATPFLQAIGSDLDMVILQASKAVYFRLDDAADYVLALRGGIGSIVGASRSEVPPGRRFYAGGGGSIRGYGYQLAGPLDEEDDPLGGRSLLTAGAEMRVKVSETIGIVPFVEVGNVGRSSVPAFDEKLFVGAGLGVRYYTAVGPIRVDLAFPLDRRSDVDDAFQIYASIGQAF